MTDMTHLTPETVTESAFIEKFPALVRAGEFKRKVADILVTPEVYLRAENFGHYVPNPVRLELGDYQMRLICEVPE
jgi:hypothetical protein